MDVMKYKFHHWGAIALIFGSFFIIGLSGFIFNTTLLLFGISALVVSIFLFALLVVIDLFRRDKNLDLEQLESMGLTIVECKNCQKKNVLEDQYCIYWGEKLDE